MADEIKDLLNEEIKNQISDLAKLEAGSKEKSIAIKNKSGETAHCSSSGSVFHC